jgi:transposase
MLPDGATYAEVHQRLGWSSRTTATWKTRFLTERLAGLRGPAWGSKPKTLTLALKTRILARTRAAPPDGSRHWSCRKLAAVLKISHSIVALVWRRAGLQPHSIPSARKGRLEDSRPLPCLSRRARPSPQKLLLALIGDFANQPYAVDSYLAKDAKQGPRLVGQAGSANKPYEEFLTFAAAAEAHAILVVRGTKR